MFLRRAAKTILLLIALIGLWSIINYHRTTTREEVLYSFTIPDRYMRVDEWPKESTEYAIEQAPFRKTLFDGTNGKSWMIAGWEDEGWESSGKKYVLINEKPVECDDYRIPHFEGAKHMVFAIRSKNKSIIFIDGKQVKTIEPEVRRIALSDDERSILCSTFQGNLKITGNKITKYHGLVDTDERFRLRTVKRGNRTSLLLDDKEIDSATGIAYPQLKPDGKKVTYWRSNNLKKWQLVANGKPLPGMVCEVRMDDNGESKPYGYFEYSPNGKRFACTVRKHQLDYLIIDGKEVDSAVGIDNLQLSPDGKRLAYWKSLDGEKWQLIMDGKPQQGIVCDCSPYYSIKGIYIPHGFVIFSPNSKRFLCLFNRNKKCHLHSEKGLLHSAPGFVQWEFSPDSKRIAYTWDNKNGLYNNESPLHTAVDGKELFPGGKSYFWGFSPDSRKYAVLKLEKSGDQAYVNDKPVGPKSKDFDLLAHFFSPDSRHLFYLIENKKKFGSYTQMVIDGKRTVPRHDEILTYPSLQQDSITYWVADYADGRRSINRDPTIDSGTTIKFVRVKLGK